MKEKVLAFLKTKLNGVAESYLSGVADYYSKTVTDESEIETALNDSVIGLLKVNAAILQQEGDRRATEAQKTALKNFMEKNGLDENGKPKTPPTPPAEPDSVQAILDKLLSERLAPLQEKLTAFEQKELQSARMNKLNERLSAMGIPKTFIKGRNINIQSDEEIDALVSEIETDFIGVRQELADSGVVVSIPRSPQVSEREGEAFGKAIAAKRNTNTSDGVVGKPI
jgi:hypothetical protein